MPVGVSAKSIDGHRELSCDREAGVRHGQCVVHTDSGDIIFKYVVQWQNRDIGEIYVRAFPADLPSCTAAEVVQTLEQTIRSIWVGASVKSIDGHTELSYDLDSQVRHGQCVVHTDGGDVNVRYDVQWHDRATGIFAVRVLPTDVPSCTSAEVMQLLEQVIRGELTGASLTSIDGHTELSYDADSHVRHGRCVVHTDRGDIHVKYVVEWLDRAKGQFLVRTLAE
jgi:predicted secreted Zn-dependent protease